MSLVVKEILNIGMRQLEEAGVADAATDSKILYCHLMGIPVSKLILEYQKTLPDSLCDEYFRLMDLRGSGRPTQYITGTQEFMGLEFKVDESVLIPRQDTETMVEDAISLLSNNSVRGEELSVKRKKNAAVLDLCCGSGAIGISLAKLCESVRVTCSDLSIDAVNIARQNADRLGVSKKVSFEQGNLLMPFKNKLKSRRFDLIISNPPYIETGVIPTLQREVRDHEPIMALDGGADGLDYYREIIADASLCLKKEGVLMLEIGHNQGEAVRGIIKASERFTDIRCLKDLAHRDRIVMAVLAGKKK